MSRILTNRNSDVLIWTLSDFQNNASRILANGVRAYYKRADGVITGCYKLGDGVNTVSVLPFFYDNRLSTSGVGIGVGYHMTTPLYGGYLNTTLNRTVLSIDVRNGTTGSFVNNYAYFGRFFRVHFPIAVSHAGVVVTSFGTGTRDLNFALYRLNADYTHSLLSVGNLISFSGVGFYIVSFPSQVLLEPDYVYTLVMYSTGGSHGYEFGSTVRSGIIYSTTGTTPVWGTMVYWTGGANLFPTTLPNTYINQFATAYHIVMYLFANINII